MAKDSPAVVARTARLIARGVLKGALATTRRAARPDAKGQPYVSKVGVAADETGAPVFLFSTLAAHTQDLLADNRASILLEAPAQHDNPLEDARCTLIGHIDQLDGETAARARTRYIAHHPRAAMYAGFGDFAMWRMTVEKVHYVGGFGAAKWAKARDYVCPADAKAFPADKRAVLLDSLNDARAADLARLVKAHSGRSARGWRAVALDPDGLSVQGPKGELSHIAFPSPAKDLTAWRARLRGLFRRA